VIVLVKGAERCIWCCSSIDRSSRTRHAFTWVKCFGRNPTPTSNDPQHKALTERVRGGVRPFLLEGFEDTMLQEMVVLDDDSCPFHVRFGGIVCRTLSRLP
jgi:hypothetical protein